MQAGARRPDSDGDEVSLLRSHPVHELAGEKTGNSIKDGEKGSNRSVIVVGPMELRFDEVLVSERQHLAVEVVNGGSHR